MNNPSGMPIDRQSGANSSNFPVPQHTVTPTRPSRVPATFLTLLLLPALTLLTSFLATGCKQSGPSGKPENVEYYTCTMHPSVKSQDPKAKCPICSMNLVPVFKKSPAPPHQHAAHVSETPGMAPVAASTNASPSEAPVEFTVPVERQQQIGVTYSLVEKHPLNVTVRAVGTVAYDKQRHWDYVARVDGYVQKLFVFSRGELVERDAPLLTLYSPDLLTTQNEFVDALRTRDETTTAKGDKIVLEGMQRLVDAAKQRLRLWNISDDQIAELEKTRKPEETLTLKSPFQGVVQDIGVDQGRRAMTGDRLVDIADLSVVWVWAQFYENEISLLKKDLPVTISTTAYPGETFKGKIALIDPFLNDASRTARARIDVENANLHLRPEMYVNVELKLEMGEGLAVPVSAILPTGQRNVAFVGRGEGRLEPRFVDVGRKYGDFYQLNSGLKEGERVVSSANFLIDAEAKVQGALRSW
jgi:membrane fusion protein, copper/silver efflux system